MKTEKVVPLLAATQLFEELDEDLLRRLANRFIQRSYKRGHRIFHQGDPGDAFFVLVEGLVKVFVTSEDGEEMVLATLKPRDTFGEVSVVDGGPRSASAEVVEAATVLALTRPALLDVLREEPAAMEVLLRALGRLVRRLTEQAADLVFLDLHGRVAKLLLSLAETSDEDAGEQKVLDLHLTQSDLAGMVGGSRQSVNQILHLFERRGYIDLQGRKIVVKSPERLRRRAGIR